MTNNTETRSFYAGATIVNHLIHSQAGSLGKAITEGVTNAIDAGATKVDITLTPNLLTIADDGHGFRSREEILKCFEVFGFDHSKHVRENGRFGLGRGQVWAYGVVGYRTRNFNMLVDVRNKGLDYELTSDLEDVPGLTLTATFYEMQSYVQLQEIEGDLRRLCKYAAITVTLNGTQINRDASKEKWTTELPEAVIRVDDTNMLDIYSQGIFVKSLYAGSTGIGGTLVTRRGHPLLLNMARNDILQADCALWKRLSRIVSSMSPAPKKSAAKRLTDHERDYLATRILAGSAPNPLEAAVITLSNGKSISIAELGDFYRYNYNQPILTTADSGHATGDLILQRKMGLVVATKTLKRFKANTVAEFLDKATRVLAANQQRDWHVHALRDLAGTGRVVEDITTTSAHGQIKSERLRDADLNAKQRLALQMIEKANEVLFVRVIQPHAPKAKRRTTFLARSSHAEAFTDGTSYIGVELSAAASMTAGGLGGYTRLCHLLIHEYLHDTDDSGSHSHDQSFYEAFHDLVLEHAGPVADISATCLRMYVDRTGKMSRKTAQQMDAVAQDSNIEAAPPA